MISSFLKTSTSAHIYIYLRLFNLYFTYLQSRSDLFSYFNLRYIYLSPSLAICTTRIYRLAVISSLKTSTSAHIYLSPSLQSVLHVFTVWQWSLFLKLQPPLIYISISVSAICTSRIYSLAGISFPKTSTCAHIYLSPSLLSVLHVFTVSQWSL